MYAEVMRSLSDGIGQALGIQVVKGFPSWGRLAAMPPVGAIRLDGFTPESAGRIGDDRGSLSWRVTLFGRHEQEMLALVEGLIQWVARTRVLTVDGKVVPLETLGGSRYISVTGAQQEEYGFDVMIQTTV